MPKKINENTPPDNIQDDGKIGFKDQKPVREGSQQMDARWKKVQGVVDAAKDAYQSGKSNFSEILDGLIATFQAMLDSEVGGKDLGGLTANGPEMNLPPEPAPEEGPQQ